MTTQKNKAKRNRKMRTETISTAEYKVFTWENPNPMPPCGINCPFYSIWEEEA